MSEPLDLRSSYDRVADDYALRIANELEHKPFDRDILDRFADRVRDLGPACDVGCGPGHVARFLHDRGVQISGADLSLGMIQAARACQPLIDFRVADMRALPFDDAALAGVVAFYSIIHIARAEHPAVFREFRRVLRASGVLLVAFHIGDSTVHLDEMWGHRVSMDFGFLPASLIRDEIEAAGFRMLDCHEREPYPDVEYASRRAYLMAETRT